MGPKAPAFNWIFVYKATILVCGLGAILWLLAMLLLQWHELSASHSFLGLTFPLYIFLVLAIVLDGFLGLFPIRFSDVTIVLNFAVPLTVLLLLASVVNGVGGATAVYSATAIVTFGAPLGELLRQLQQKPAPSTHLARRMGLYMAVNAVASLLSTIAFLVVVEYLPSSLSQAAFIQPPLIATTAYAIFFFIASKLIRWPHDRAIDQFLLPDEQSLPHVDLATLIAIIPIPFFIVVLIGNLFRRGGTTAEIVQIILLLGLFAAFILVARSYAQVEITGAAQQERGRLDQALRGSVNMVELSKRLGELLQQERYPYRWGAFYTQQGLPSLNGTYHLRAHMDKQGNTITFAKEFIEAGHQPPMTKEGKQPDEEVVCWPRWVNKNEGGFLARTANTGQLQITVGHGQSPQQSSDLIFARIEANSIRHQKVDANRGQFYSSKRLKPYLSK